MTGREGKGTEVADAELVTTRNSHPFERPSPPSPPPPTSTDNRKICAYMGVQHYPSVMFLGHGSYMVNDPISRFFWGSQRAPERTIMYTGDLYVEVHHPCVRRPVPLTARSLSPLTPSLPLTLTFPPPSRLLPPVLLLVHARREVGDVEDLPLLLLPTRVAGEVRVESANGCGWRGREMHEWLRRIGRNRCSWRKNGPVSLLPLTSSQSWGMSCQACSVGHSASPASRPAWPARPAGGTPVGVVSGQGQSTGDDVRTSAG